MFFVDHSFSEGGRCFEATRYWVVPRCFLESSISLILKCCSPSTIMGCGGVAVLDLRCEVISGIKRLQWNTGCTCLRVFGNWISIVTGFMIPRIGKGPINFGPSFLEGCKD